MRRLPNPADGVIEIPLHVRNAADSSVKPLEGSTMLPVPFALLGAREHHPLEVASEPMVCAGIFDGDHALIRRTGTFRSGRSLSH